MARARTKSKVLSVDEAFAKLRADKQLGRGSCSTVDETYTDAELIDDLGELKKNTGGRFTWPQVRNHYDRIERIFWEEQGIKWPIRSRPK